MPPFNTVSFPSLFQIFVFNLLVKLITVFNDYSILEFILMSTLILVLNNCLLD